MARAGTLTLDRVLTPASDAPVALPAYEAPARGLSSRALLAAAALVVAAGAAIRFSALSASIWFDESVSVRDVSGSFGQMLHRVINHEGSPPFYFICLWVWRQLVGGTVADLRTLSALAGTLSIVLALSVGRRHIGPRAGLLLAVCVAVSPVLVYYSNEMRMYGVLILITGISFAAFLRASEGPSWKNLSVWALASLLALWTQYYAALAVAPQAAWLLGLAWKRRPRDRATFLAVGGVTLGALPLLYLLPYQAHHAFAYGGPLLSSPWHQIPTNIHAGSTAAAVAQELAVGPGGAYRALLTLLIFMIGTVALWRFLVNRTSATKGQLIRALFLVGPALVAVAIVLGLHLLVEGRYLLPFWLPVGLAVCAMLASPAAGRLGLCLAVALVTIWVGVSVVTAAVPEFGARDDTLGAARSLGVATTGRLIAMNQPWDELTFEQYRPETTADTSPIVRVRELDVVGMPVGGEPDPAAHQRPSSLRIGRLPQGLKLAQIIRGPTFVVERFLASAPVAIRVDGHGSAFRAADWRFLNEPAGGRMGGL